MMSGTLAIKLREADLFQDLSDEILEALAPHCHEMELAAGDTLFEQDSAGDTFYLLDDGQIHIIREYESGDEVVLATLGPYYTIGELSTVVGLPRTGKVVAVSDCTLIALSRDAFEETCQQYPAVAVRVMHRLGQRLYYMNLLVREHAVGNIVARIASMLLLLCNFENGVVSENLKTNRMARASGVDMVVLHRILDDWNRQGYISFDGKRLEVHNVGMIEDFAG